LVGSNGQLSNYKTQKYTRWKPIILQTCVSLQTLRIFATEYAMKQHHMYLEYHATRRLSS